MSSKSRSPDSLFFHFGFTNYEEQKDVFLATKEFALREIKLDFSKKFSDRPAEEQNNLVTAFVRNAFEYMHDNNLLPYISTISCRSLIPRRTNPIDRHGCRQYLINKSNNKMKVVRTKHRARTNQKATKGRPRKPPEPVATQTQRQELRSIAPSTGEEHHPFGQGIPPYVSMSAYNNDSPFERSFSQMPIISNQPPVNALIREY